MMAFSPKVNRPHSIKSKKFHKGRTPIPKKGIKEVTKKHNLTIPHNINVKALWPNNNPI
jgi:hypothetical protein